MTFATGIEYREDRYGIQAGEPASYYGAGAASFPGYNPDVNTGSYKRDNYAGYVNFIFVPTNPWLVDVALRYENYSDFGNESVGKITTRYDFTEQFALRATASTGFRAPTLGEGYYSAVSVGPTSARPQLQPNSSAAAALGFGAGLQPETSENFSAGLVLRPVSGLVTTLDAYQITIKDRIQLGSFAFSTSQATIPSQVVLLAPLTATCLIPPTPMAMVHRTTPTMKHWDGRWSTLVTSAYGITRLHPAAHWMPPRAPTCRCRFSTTHSKHVLLA